ncbi:MULTISPECIES: hypothetical protein [unclassified Nostoc]|uniref:hypothetical protein n=1 Tax=unclassified Nostoc TaxID=2593658 RepID=UPI0025F18D79|nr:hypothetical protein [Nostoc sp. NOS(2021)]
MPRVLADITADPGYVLTAKIPKYKYYGKTTQVKIVYLVTQDHQMIVEKCISLC